MKKIRNIKYYIYILIAGCLWGTMSIFVKALQACGSNAFYTSFLRMFFSLIILHGGQPDWSCYKRSPFIFSTGLYLYFFPDDI